MHKSSQMVLKGVNWVHNTKSGHMGKESIGYTMIKSSQMVLKGVSWVQYAKQQYLR